MRYIFMVTIFSVVFAFEKDITVTVQAGRSDCFFQHAQPNQVIDIEYQVIDASHGELDISFQLADPVGQIIVGDYKKQENSHRHTATLNGDYRFCFDNTFSTFSDKTVFFDILIDEEREDNDYDDDDKIDLGNSAETYMMRVREITESLARVRDSVAAARRAQEALAAREARDRNLAEDMCDRVLKRSIVQIMVMILIGLTQVFFVKSLFEDGRSSFRKYLPKFITQ